MEWRLQESNYASTFEYHQYRDRAPHLEQDEQRPRLLRAAELVVSVNPESVVDLGCGDGGMLSVLKGHGIHCWGYDFCPANAQGWVERRVEAAFLDIFHSGRDAVVWGSLTVATEILEHLDHPHDEVKWISENSQWIVASSPWDETPENTAHDHHIWGWDFEGYRALIEPHFEIISHEQLAWSQLILGKSRVSKPLSS